MNSIEETLVRNMIRHIFVIAHDGEIELSDQTRQLLSGMTPLEIERVVDLCRVNIRVDFDSVIQNIRRVRNHTLMLELVKAGASNQLLRDLFGVNHKELSRHRAETGANPPSRRHLTEDEETLVLQRHERSPIPENHGPPFTRAAWALDASRELDLPYMAVYRSMTIIVGPSGNRT